MDAIDKFDPDRGLQFQTYAVSRIRGAIVDGLRASDWVPRSVREKIRDIDAAQARLERQLGPRAAGRRGRRGAADHRAPSCARCTARPPTPASSASRPPPSTTRRPRARPVDLPGADDDIPPGFLAAVRELPERDQIVVALYYWERLTLAEIGQVLGVTESRVSQLHSRATMTLRRKLSDAVH